MISRGLTDTREDARPGFARQRWIIGAVAALAAAGAGMWWTFRVRGAGDAAAPIDNPVILDGTPRLVVRDVYYLGDFGSAAAYLVHGATSAALIDSGFGADEVLDPVRKLGIDPARIRTILLSHLHTDHISGAEAIRKSTGARIWAGAKDAPFIENGGPIERFTDRGYFTFRPFPVDRRLAGGERLDLGGLEIEAIATPGHSPGSTSYLLVHDGKHILFSGDAVLSLLDGLGTYIAYRDPGVYGGDAEAYLATFRRLREIPVDILLPGHPLFGGHPSPRIGPDAWRRLIDKGIAEMDTLVERYRKDGKNFLNGEARWFLPRLLYLGDLGAAGDLDAPAVYALRAEGGIVLIDTGPAEAVDTLTRRLAAHGFSLRDVKAVLLTSTGENQAGALAEVVAASNARVLCAAAGEVEARALAQANVEALQGSEGELEFGDLRITYLATPGREPAGTSYLIDVAGKRVAFTGAIVVTTPGGHVTRLLKDLSTNGRGNRAKYDASLQRLRMERVDLWCPSCSNPANNANLYDVDWETLIRNAFDASGGALSDRQG